MRIIGLDIGSRTVKRVTVDNSNIVEHLVVPNNHDPLLVCDKLLHDRQFDCIVATGYGRHLFAEHRKAETITEIKAVALGARYMCSQARTLIDIGGQDTKIVLLDEKGNVLKFEMNDRCAAGTGRFLEVMATTLSYKLSNFIKASLRAKTSKSINAMCTVFAESEVISAIAGGVDRTQLARGLHDAVIHKVIAMLRRFDIKDKIVFCGGGALNQCLLKLLTKSLDREIYVPDNPQIAAATGAALSKN